jgi:hypothetical protein
METEYMYYVEYFCNDEFEENFKRAKKREMEKFNEVLTKQIFMENGGYVDSFLISEYFDSENKAFKFAKQISKKNKDLARVFAGWCCYDEFGRFDIDEYDENYLVQFEKGVNIDG